jgi:uncharacterized protein (TIGR00730 family)
MTATRSRRLQDVGFHLPDAYPFEAARRCRLEAEHTRSRCRSEHWVAEELARALTARGLGLVYGGARVGLMGVLADTVLGAGGEVIGVIPARLLANGIAHDGLTELRVAGSVHERGAVMAGLADAFVALPGGWGTLEELDEALTCGQLGFHLKPCGVLNVQGYFDSLLSSFRRSVAMGFVRPEHSSMVLVADSPDALLDALAAYEPRVVEKWLRRRAPRCSRRRGGSYGRPQGEPVSTTLPAPSIAGRMIKHSCVSTTPFNPEARDEATRATTDSPVHSSRIRCSQRA